VPSCGLPAKTVSTSWLGAKNEVLVFCSALTQPIPGYRGWHELATGDRGGHMRADIDNNEWPIFGCLGKG